MKMPKHSLKLLAAIVAAAGSVVFLTVLKAADMTPAPTPPNDTPVPTPSGTMAPTPSGTYQALPGVTPVPPGITPTPTPMPSPAPAVPPT